MFSPETVHGIKNIIGRVMENVLDRRIRKEPWDYKKECLIRPFHIALVPEAIWKGSKFERSFVTTLGMVGWEQIARLIAEEKHGFAENGYKVIGKISSNQMHEIQSILNQLEGSRKPVCDEELKQILTAGSYHQEEKFIETKVTSDLYVYNEIRDLHYYFEIKAPKPNSDQSKVSKEKIYKIKAMYPESNHRAYFALPYNPYGIREKYSWAHPNRWFDMKKSPLVLIGREFWEVLGGEGTFNDLISVFEEVGSEYRDIIKKDYLNL